MAYRGMDGVAEVTCAKCCTSNRISINFKNSISNSENKTLSSTSIRLLNCVVHQLSTLYRSCVSRWARSAFRFMQIARVGIEFTDKNIVRDLLHLFWTANKFRRTSAWSFSELNSRRRMEGPSIGNQIIRRYKSNNDAVIYSSRSIWFNKQTRTMELCNVTAA